MTGLSPVEGTAVAHKTLADFGAERLANLCEGLGVGAASRQLVELFRALVYPWGSHRIGTVPRYRSNVADDQAPFEFAIAISKGPPEIQAYVDPQGDPPTLSSNQHAARELLATVSERFNVSLERFRAIEGLFLPEDPQPPFSLWLGVSWQPGRNILPKIYLNPQVRGSAEGPELMAEAMERLGLRAAWRSVEQVLSLRDGRDEIGIVALDLEPAGPTRLKIYIRHHRVSVPEVLPVMELTGEFAPRDITTFYSSLSGSQGPFLKKPIASVFAFRDSGSTRPAAVSLEFPIGKYVENDEVARHRVGRCLRTFGLATDAYERAIHAFAIRPPAARAGIHAHVTLRRLTSGPRVGIYFASQAYGDMSWPEAGQGD